MFAINDPSATYKLLWEAFEARGYVCEDFYVHNIHYVKYTSPMGKVWLTKAEQITYPVNPAIVSTISTHKSIAYAFAERARVSIPETIVINSNDKIDDKAIDDLLEKHGSLIVKPENASLSRGLSINLTDKQSVFEALEMANKFSSSLLVQQQVAGEEIRFVILNGKVHAAMLRETAQLVGDGVSKISDLLEIENEARRGLRFTHISYPELDDEIITKHYSRDSIPALGEVIKLASSTMIKGGASIYNVVSNVHESYIKTVVSLAKSIGAEFIVVDLFVQDYTVPQSATNAYFIEFNTAPVLKLFYGARDGVVFDAVPLIVDAIDKHLHAI